MKPNSAVEEPPHNKKEKVETSTLCPLLWLPNGVGLSCLVRVSTSDYGALSRVSKRYRSLVVSPELYKMRSVMGLMETRHYVCLSTINDVIPRWFILRRENTKFGLIPIPSIPPQDSNTKFVHSSVVVLDWGIYVIGGWVSKKTKSTNVWRLDCQNHTWCKLPSMAVARSSPAAGVIDGKIYVFGGCKKNMASNWGEVFDPKTETWDTLVSLPDRNVRLEWINASLVIENKLYAVENSRILYFSPSEGKWGRRNFDSQPYICSRYVMVDNLLYIYSFADSGKLFWCEKDEFEWKEVKGLDSLHMTLRPSMVILYKLVKFGENIVVFWRAAVELWCAEISLERPEEGDEIWGKVEWSDSLTTLDHPFYPFWVLSYSAYVYL